MTTIEPTREIRGISIEQEMRTSYLDYAMSVIVTRALPDARDGLKPVQRRILWGMWDAGARANTGYRKSAGIVGDVLGRYHPHNDVAVYDAMVRMAQPFSLRYMLVDGQGNFGSVDGDPAAAMRYTEVRMSPIAEELVADIDENTVDFEENYDGRHQQPVVLPARVPNLLLNGSSGIAVGMATNIPPHNFREIADAVALLVDRPDATLDDILEFVQGPDFPTAGIALVGKNREQVRMAYGEGHGRVTMRAKTMIEEGARGRTQIVITELPYQVNKSSLIEKIADLVRDRKIEGIADIRDESDRHGMRVVIELKREGQAQQIRNLLFKHTPMRSTFAINMMAILDGAPRRVGLKRALEIFIAHRHEALRRRSEYRLQKARDREHILAGLLKAIDMLDQVIAAIRGAGSPQQALALLQGLEPLPEGVREFWSRTTRRWPSNGRNPFDFTEVQARAILDMQLRRLTGLERQELLDEHAVVMERIAYLEDLLANPRKIDFLIKDDILELKNKYGDVRRTEIVEADPEDFAEEDLVPHQESVITLSMRNYVKRTPLEDYRTQRRGGQGSRGAQIREEDAVVRLVVCDSHDSLLVFTDQGRVYQMRAFDIPDAKKQAKGTFITNLIELEPGERVTTIVAAREFSSDFMVLATRAGAVKKTPLSEFEEVRRNGKIAMRLDDGDELVSAQIATKESWVLLVTSNGQAIRFHCDDLREASRASGGVRGIRMASGVYLVGASVVRSEDEQLLVVTEKGFGKRTAAGQYPVQGRGGQGVRTLNITPKTGNVATCRVVSPDEQLMLISRDGIVMRTQVDTISLLGRATQGVTIMRMGTEDIVSAVAVVALTPEAEGKRKAAAAGGNGGRAAPRRTNGHNPSAT